MKKSKTTIPDWLSKAREKWEFTGKKRPSFAEEPGKGQISVWDFPRPPALEKVQQEVTIFAGDIRLVKTNNAFAVCETASPPTYYIPPQDVNTELLVQIPKKKSLCEWKGSANYWSLKTTPEQGIGWSYANPFSPFQSLKGYIAFYPQMLECFVGDEKIRPQSGQFYAGWITSNLTGPFKGEPGTEHW